MNKLAKALGRLMPLGGWSFKGSEVTVHEDGLVHGYSVPSQQEIDAEIAKIEADEPKLKQLSKLDNIITRDKEDKANELGVPLDPVEQAVVDEKIQLRNQLV